MFEEDSAAVSLRVGTPINEWSLGRSAGSSLSRSLGGSFLGRDDTGTPVVSLSIAINQASGAGAHKPLSGGRPPEMTVIGPQKSVMLATASSRAKLLDSEQFFFCEKM